MASFNLTVEDSSPLISYLPAGAWVDSPSNDTLLSSYSGSSYHSTSTEGATATIHFNGTGLTIFGGHRTNYGTYQISVDGHVVASGTSAGQSAVLQIMGSASGLANGNHTAVLSSSSSSPIDIDFVSIETEIGEPGSSLAMSTIDDSDNRFVYTPQSEWSVNDQNLFIDNTLHYTQSAGASASVTFSGDAVALYGTVSEDHADVHLTLDGESVTFGAGANGLASTLHTKVLLYYAVGLGPNQHNLTVTADPETNTGPFIDVDAVFVYSTNGGSSTGASQPSSTSQSSPQRDVKPSKMSEKTMIGIIVGSVVGFLLLLALLFLFLRWRRRRRQNQDEIRSPLTPTLPIQQLDMLEAGQSTRPIGNRLSQNSMTSFYSGPQDSLGHSREHSNVETVSVSSTAPINTASATVSSNHSMRSNTPTRPNQRPPPLAL
jgi:hypothetical protein